MEYLSTRGKNISISSAEAIVKGISADGGLFVPLSIPEIKQKEWLDMEKMSYQERAVIILSHFLSDFTQEEIKEFVYAAYNNQQFDDELIAPLNKLDKTTYIMELWHGPTSAFKDMALQILPYLLKKSAEKIGEEADILILVATSGDTGKAALEGFKDVEGTKIIVFYPQEGVSEVQKRQMITQEGNNVDVVAVKGNFDDAQGGVKEIFADKDFAIQLEKENIKLSSANSINWGRLVPQIIYYISAYVDLKKQALIKDQEKINIVVPTGNFGNILAAYYAKCMGLPVNKLICASNANNVLCDFLSTGVYDRNRKFEKTISPSMDILISSNLERLLFDLTGHDDKKISLWMEELKNEGVYKVEEEILLKLKEIFWAAYAEDDETIQCIKETWENEKYLLDSHTAVAINVYQKYKLATKDETPAIIVSTANPYKFTGSVAQALMQKETLMAKEEFELLEILEQETQVMIPERLKGLDKKEVLHQAVCNREDMKNTILEILKK